MPRFDHVAIALVSSIVWSAPAVCAELATVDEAQRRLFPDATAFAAKPVALSDDQRMRIKELSGVAQREAKQSVWEATRDGDRLGWFVVDDVVGKHEFITYAVALSASGTVVGIEILQYRETHGGQVVDAAWRKNFVGKSLKDPFKLDEDVPNISGATLSCRNVMNGVKRLLALQRVALGGDAPAPADGAGRP